MSIRDYKVREAILMVYDITGYTSFSDHHESRGDYKAVWELTSAVTGRSNEIIEEAGGTLHTFTGDGYLVSFNGNAHRKSINSALDLQELAREIRSARDIPGGDGLRLKVALYKGEGLFGILDDGTYTPFGRAPSKLSRIENMTRPGEILASGSVIDPVIDSYEVDSLEGITLRGIINQRKIYRVLGRMP